MLRSLYEQVEMRIKEIRFNTLWEGFERCDFALYNDAEVIINGQTLPKTEVFLGNTAIWYEGRYIAIWKFVEEMDVDTLTSKIIHEMFHAYQNKQAESRYVNEREAIWKYVYSPEYLQVKYDENKLLIALNETFDRDKMERLLMYRKIRQQQYPYEYHYESMIEVIEGSATFVELQALKVLNRAYYHKQLESMLDGLSKMEELIPIRIISYDIGALLLKVCIENEMPVALAIGQQTAGFFDALVNEVPYETYVSQPTEQMIQYYETSNRLLENKINTIKGESKAVIKGSFELLGFNVYSARYKDGYVYTQYFLMYKDEAPIVLQGDCVFKLENNRVTEIYRC